MARLRNRVTGCVVDAPPELAARLARAGYDPLEPLPEEAEAEPAGDGAESGADGSAEARPGGSIAEQLMAAAESPRKAQARKPRAKARTRKGEPDGGWH